MKALSTLAITALLATACSGSPTAPSPVDDAASPRIQNMRWDVAAPGCSPDPAPIPVPLADEAALEPDRQGIAATWEWRLDDRDVLLIAHFVEDDHLLKLCSWDTADL